MIINILDQDTINKIAAGEVIERPSAVIKETLENAIDAKANSVTVETKDGGTTFIRITDNGKGIDKDDIPLAFKSHATSKIRHSEDLQNVLSFGFRGEALSSIAAVAKVELISKTPSSFTGYRYMIEGGEELEFSPVGCPDGSTFIIKDLFYNTPARKKFLKTNQTESSYIQEIMERIAISHPEVAIKYIADGKTKLQTPGNGRQKDSIYYIFGREIASNLFEVDFEDEKVSVTGFTGKPVVTRGNRNFENYYVNGRYIKSNIINKAIEDAYAPFIMQHRYPFTSLMININSEDVDVNVHPQKAEVRFANGESIYNAVYHAVNKALRSEELIPSVSLTEEKKKEEVKPVLPKINEYVPKKEIVTSTEIKKEAPQINVSERIEAPKDIKTVSYDDIPKEERNFAVEDPSPEYSAKPKRLESTFIADEVLDELIPARVTVRSETHDDVVSVPLTEEKPVQMNFISEEAKPNYRIIGQLFDTYWLFEYNDYFYMMDQHAAHEKVKYERFIKVLKERTPDTQRLMPPVIVTLSDREKNALNSIKDHLSKCGFDIDPFGGHEYAISGIPTETYTMDPSDMLISILDEYTDTDKIGTPESVLEKIASMSCKAAVKGNNRLSVEEAQKLMDELVTLDNPYNCPHGRPTLIKMSKNEIEKKFKRIV